MAHERLTNGIYKDSDDRYIPPLTRIYLSNRRSTSKQTQSILYPFLLINAVAGHAAFHIPYTGPLSEETPCEGGCGRTVQRIYRTRSAPNRS